MAVQNIIHDQMFLQRKSQPATKADLNIAIDLRDTLIAKRNLALGLAANMIGKDKRIIAFYVGPLAMVMINPRIIDKEERYITKEGCLSLSGERSTKRYKKIRVSFQTMNFENRTQEFDGLTSEVIQHEIDHCDGILI